MNFFKSKIKKYEFYLFEGNERMVDKQLKNLQSLGWELAGEIGVKFSDCAGGNRMLIPLKRIIKK